jgi:dihydropyrimidinase
VILIRNGRVITPDADRIADVLIEGEVIKEIGPDLQADPAKTIDAGGKYVIPGGIDVHTHLEASVGNTISSDDFETGTRAAAFGGTTCIIDFAQQSHGKSMMDALEIWRGKGAKAVVDYGFHMIITDLSSTGLEELDRLVKEGVTSFKLFMAYPDALMVDDGTLLRVLRKTAQINALACIHAENGTVINLLAREAVAKGRTSPIYHVHTRPPVLEGEAVHRAVALASLAEAPLYIVHVTCEEGLAGIAQGRDHDVSVFAETCPQYLLLSSSDVDRPDFEGAKFVLTPPLRDKKHQEKLWEGLHDGLLQVVSTDHCPFNFHGQKDLGRDTFAKIPNGGPGIENRLQLMYHHGVTLRGMTLQEWVNIVSTMPAKLFGLYPRKGIIAVGSDADLVIWDPTVVRTISASTHHMRVDYSMYEGFMTRGAPETVLSRGEIIVDKGEWLGRKGRGRFMKRDIPADYRQFL